MSYCCSTCGNLDRAGGFDPLYEVVTGIGWDGLVELLKLRAADPAIQVKVAMAEKKAEKERAAAEERRLADEKRREEKWRRNQERRVAKHLEKGHEWRYSNRFKQFYCIHCPAVSEKDPR